MKTSPILEIWPLNKLQSYTLNVWVTGLWESSLLSWPFFLQLPVNVDHTTPEATEKTTCLYKDFLVAQSERWRIFYHFPFKTSIWPSLPGSEQLWWEFTVTAASMSRDETLAGKESSSFVLEKESLSVTLLVHPNYAAISYLPVSAKDLPQYAISCPDSPCLQPPVPYSADFHQRHNEFSAGLPLCGTMHSAISLGWSEHLGCAKDLAKGCIGRHKERSCICPPNTGTFHMTFWKVIEIAWFSNYPNILIILFFYRLKSIVHLRTGRK